MPSVIVDWWSFWRVDMRARARAILESEAWRHLATHQGDPHRLDSIPMLSLDWDGKDEPNGGAVARVVANGFFLDSKKACDALIASCGLPVIEAKHCATSIVLRVSAPIDPKLPLTGWALL